MCARVCVCVEEGVRDLVGMWIADRCVHVCMCVWKRV